MPPYSWHRTSCALLVRPIAAIAAAAAAALTCSAAAAHKASDAYLSLQPHEQQISVRWDIALRDLDNELGLDADDDGNLTWGEVRARHADIAALALAQLTIRSAGVACQIAGQPDSPGITGARSGDARSGAIAAAGVHHQLDHHSDGTYAVLSFELSCPAKVDVLDVDYHLFSRSDPTHRGIVSVVWPGKPGAVAATAILGPDNPHRRFTPFSQSLWETLREFVGEGIWHIWLGFDHILFLLSLLLPAVLAHHRKEAKDRSPAPATLQSAALDVVKIVTAFTLAHSITLTLAVLDVVSLPSRLVESGIALTVILASLNNLWPVMRDRRWLAAFAFGLIHGFGFAAALKDLGLSAHSLLVSLFGFNLGVELGQLAIVAFFLPSAYMVRNTLFYRVGIFRFGSASVALIALFWFIERAFDVDLSRVRV